MTRSYPTRSSQAPIRSRVRPLRAAWIATLCCAVTLFAAVPEFGGRCRPGAHASAAVATLKNLHTAQERLRSSGAIDQDDDGEGEYGYLRELAGSDPSLDLDPPLLSAAFRKISGGRVRRSAYVFQVFLPGADGTWVPEAPAGGREAGAVDADRAERAWLAYAWPEQAPSASDPHRRTFMISDDGVVLATAGEQEAYGGDAAPPAGIAAHRCEGASRERCVDRPDARGNVWVRVH